MPLRRKIKCVFMRFRHTGNFRYRRQISKNLTASPGVERVRTPSACFFGTFFRTSKKVRQQCAASTFTWRCDRLQFTRTGDRKRKLYFSRECVLLTSINQRIKIKTKVHLLKRKSRKASHEWGEWDTLR